MQSIYYPLIGGKNTVISSNVQIQFWPLPVFLFCSVVCIAGVPVLQRNPACNSNYYLYFAFSFIIYLYD